MSNYKPFHEKVADLFVQKLESGSSPFQSQSSGQPVLFENPVNASTGKNYKGLNALWLAMQPHQDPRWITMNQANKMDIKIPKGSTATMINIVKTSESFPMLDDDGKRMKGENGKPLYHTVPLEKPTEEAHWVFNAAQLAFKHDAPLKTDADSGIDRIHKLIAASGTELTSGKKNVESYDVTRDQILVAKDPNFYKTEMDYAGAVVLQLAHWTAHPDRLNRPAPETLSNADYASEQLKTGIATLMLASETGITKYPTAHFERFIPEWISMIKSEPAVLARAANDAQKIVDFVLEAENKLGLRQNTALRPMRLDLAVGDQINYNNTTYQVSERMKGDKLKIHDLNSGANLPISSADGLYKSLVQAKYRGDSPAQDPGKSQSNDNDQSNTLAEDQTAYRTLKR